MAAILRDEAASPAWPRPRSRYPSRSRSTLYLALRGVGSLNERRPPLSRRPSLERFGDSRDVLGRVAAATAGNVDQPSPCEVAQKTGHVLRPQIEPGFRQRIRQAGIWVARDRHVHLLRDIL